MSDGIRLCGKKRGRKKSWDTAVARAAYERGLTDKEIAKLVDKCPDTIGAWRRSEGLPVNKAKSSGIKRPAIEHDPKQCIGCIYWRRLGSSGGATIM